MNMEPRKRGQGDEMKEPGWTLGCREQGNGGHMRGKNRDIWGSYQKGWFSQHGGRLNQKAKHPPHHHHQR